MVVHDKSEIMVLMKLPTSCTLFFWDDRVIRLFEIKGQDIADFFGENECGFPLRLKIL